MPKDKSIESIESTSLQVVSVNYQNIDELFPLGVEYVDKVTGIKGTATARQLHHNGCITVTIEPSQKSKKKNGVKNQVVNIVRLGGSPFLLHDALVQVDDTVKHPLLDSTVRNDHTGIEGLVSLIHRTIEGFDHVYVLPPGNNGGKPKDLVEFSVKEIGVKHNEDWLSPTEYIKAIAPKEEAIQPVSQRPSPVSMGNVHRKFPH